MGRRFRGVASGAGIRKKTAPIIVLWNALVLHARWGGMVQDRGWPLAVSDIAVAWSMFGVNQLSVGLHSYGFTEGIALALLVFVASQLGVVALACCRAINGGAREPPLILNRCSARNRSRRWAISLRAAFVPRLAVAEPISGNRPRIAAACGVAGTVGPRPLRSLEPGSRPVAAASWAGTTDLALRCR